MCNFNMVEIKKEKCGKIKKKKKDKQKTRRQKDDSKLDRLEKNRARRLHAFERTLRCKKFISWIRKIEEVVFSTSRNGTNNTHQSTSFMLKWNKCTREWIKFIGKQWTTNKHQLQRVSWARTRPSKRVYRSRPINVLQTYI